MRKENDDQKEEEEENCLYCTQIFYVFRTRNLSYTSSSSPSARGAVFCCIYFLIVAFMYCLISAHIYNKSKLKDRLYSANIYIL